MVSRSRPFRFAFSVNHMPPTVKEWRDAVLMADDLGYSQVILGDHVGEARYSSMVAFAAAAGFSSSLRFGTIVFNNDFRHPVMVAKDAATLDHMTEGRYQLGLGAGWMTSDYTSTGIARDPGRVRIARLEESVKIIKGLFGDGPVSFDGEHYQISDLEGLPKPVQSRLPIFIGGGTRALLTMAGREADIVGLQPVHRGGSRGGGPELSSEALGQRSAWVKEGAAGRYDEIELHLLVHGIAVATTAAAGAEKISARFGLTPEEALVSPYLLLGPVEKIAEDLLGLREKYDLSYFSIRYATAPEFAPVLSILAGA